MMNTVGEREIRTQGRVATFFNEVLGYAYLGHWQERPNNSNIEKGLLTDWLRSRGHDDAIITKVLFELEKAATVGGTKTLVDANREVYGFLRYGVNVQPSTGEHRDHRQADRLGEPPQQRFRYRRRGNPQRREHQTS